MNYFSKTVLVVVVTSVLTGFLQQSAMAQKRQKFRSGWAADETYENIQFEFTRIKDPGGTGDDYFTYGYKNNSNKKLRISFSITGAGLTTPRSGSVVVKPMSTNGGVRSGMYLNGDRGGALTSKITRLEEVGNRQNSIYSDFKELDKNLSPKKKKELSNKEISRILKDNRKEVVARSKHHRNQISKWKSQKATTGNKGRTYKTDVKNSNSIAKARQTRNQKPSKETENSTTGFDEWLVAGGQMGCMNFILYKNGVAKERYNRKGNRTGTWSIKGSRLSINVTEIQFTGELYKTEKHVKQFRGSYRDKNGPRSNVWYNIRYFEPGVWHSKKLYE